MRLCIILFIVPRSVVFHNQSFCATCEGDLIYQFFFFLKIFKIVFDDSSYNNDVEQFMYILNPKISVGRKLNSGYIRCKYAIYRILVKKLWKWVSIELFCRRKRHDWMVHRKWRIELKTGKVGVFWNFYILMVYNFTHITVVRISISIYQSSEQIFFSIFQLFYFSSQRKKYQYQRSSISGWRFYL